MCSSDLFPSHDKEITPEVKRQLLALIEEYKSKHPKVSIELKDVLEQIQDDRMR